MQPHQPSPHTSSPPYVPPTAYAPPPAKPTGFWRTTAGVATGVVVGLAAFAGLMIGGLMLISAIANRPPDATGAVTSCTFSDVGDGSAEIGYQVTNTGDEPVSVVITFVVLNSTGDEVGRGVDGVVNLGAGNTTDRTMTVLLNGPGPAKCDIADIS